MRLSFRAGCGVIACVAAVGSSISPADAIAMASNHIRTAEPGRGTLFLVQEQGRTMPGGRQHGGRRGGGGGGISGVGTAIGIIGGAIAIGKAMEAAQEDEREQGRRTPPKRNREPKPKKIVVTAPQRDDISCKGGKVRSGSCICDKGETRRKLGRGSFACQGRLPDVDVVVPKRDRDNDAVVTRTPPPPISNPPSLSPAAPPVAPPVAVVVGPADIFVPNEVLVTLPLSTPETVEQDLARDLNLERATRLESALLGTRIVVFRIPDNRSVATVLAALRADGRGAEAQENFYYRHQGGSVGVASNELQYALAKADVTTALGLAQGRGALIAVIDSAVDPKHPDLAQGIANIYDATGEETYVPDAHGTAIAGILKANGTVRGVAPGATVLSVRAFKPREPGGPAITTSLILIRAMDWAVAQKARVLNLSFVGPRDPLFEKTVRAAIGKNAILVAAAGNNGKAAPPAYPAAYADVIAVTATDAADHVYLNANQGSYVAVAAPGVDVIVLGINGAYAFQTGTSFAAAHVSGIIALMLERNPGLSAQAARRALAETAVDLGAPGPDSEFGAGRASAFKALQTLDQVTATSQRR